MDFIWTLMYMYMYMDFNFISFFLSNKPLIKYQKQGVPYKHLNIS